MEMKNTRQGGADIWPAWRMWLWAVCEVFVLYALLRRLVYTRLRAKNIPSRKWRQPPQT